METNVEQLLAAKRLQSEEKIRKLKEEQLARQERISKQIESGLESYEQQIRERATFVSNCLTKEYCPELLHHWFRLDNWTVEQGLILLCGFSPDHVPLDEEGGIDIPIYFSESLMADHYLGHPKPETLIWGNDARKRRELSRIRRLDNLQIYEVMTMQLLGESNIRSIALEFKLAHQEVLRLWKSGSHIERSYSPKYFMDWAINKRIAIRWLEWAKTNGYYGDLPVETSIVSTSKTDKDVLPKSETAYLNIIGALLEIYWTASHPGEAYSQSVVLEVLEKYNGFTGMSERNLKDKLTKGLRSIQGR